ncbi:MAG: TIM barrel protein [Steroidobacteraceae bacterium]
MPRFAANVTTMFQELPFLERFEAAAEAGFDAVECQFPYAHSADDIAAKLARTRLDLVMFNFPAGDFAAGERGFAAHAHERDRFQQSVRTGIDYALATHTKRLHLLAGCGDPANPAALETYVSSLQWAAEQVAKHGIELLIEPLSPRDMPGYFLNSFALAEHLIERLALPALKLQFDIYHRQILHGDVTVELRKLVPVIGHVQIASVPQRQEPNTGELDDFRLFRELDVLGYRGHVGCEYTPAAGTRNGLRWLSEWKNAMAQPR